jgi:PAB-dependent poly(A)-specific ribonuclease subunit 2
VTSAAVSPTGGYLAFGDADGLIHLLSDAKEDEEPPPLNGFEGQPIQWADKAPPLPEIEWDNKTSVRGAPLSGAC